MIVKTIQKIELNDEEISIIKKATILINLISNELDPVPSWICDKQLMPEVLEELIRAALKLENKKIYSVFNMLTDDARNRLMKEISE